MVKSSEVPQGLSHPFSELRCLNGCSGIFSRCFTSSIHLQKLIGLDGFSLWFSGPFSELRGLDGVPIRQKPFSVLPTSGGFSQGIFQYLPGLTFGKGKESPVRIPSPVMSCRTVTPALPPDPWGGHKKCEVYLHLSSFIHPSRYPVYIHQHYFW